MIVWHHHAGVTVWYPHHDDPYTIADILVAPFTVSKTCRAARVLVDRRALKRGGAHALFIDGLSIRTETVTHARRNRPWTRADTHAKTRTRHGLTK